MQLKEVKLRFESGNLKAAFISEAVFEKGYNLNIQGKKQSDSFVLANQRGEGGARNFKTIDTAAKAARDIGFMEVAVKWSHLA
jgi:hypothetical protein